MRRFIYLIVTKENHVSKNIGKPWFQYKEFIMLKNAKKKSEYLLQKKKEKKKQNSMKPTSMLIFHSRSKIIKIGIKLL